MTPVELKSIAKQLLTAERGTYNSYSYLDIKNVDDSKPADADCRITHINFFEGGVSNGLYKGLLGFEVKICLGQHEIFLSGKITDVFPYIAFFPHVYRDALCTNGAPEGDCMDGMREVESVFNVPQGKLNLRLSSLNIWFQLDLVQILEKLAKWSPKQPEPEVAVVTVLPAAFEWDL